jgi:hypothetical protein
MIISVSTSRHTESKPIAILPQPLPGQLGARTRSTATHLLLAMATGEEIHHMKQHSYTLFAAFALTGLVMTLNGCQQAPAPVSAAPAPASTPAPQVVVEERGHRDDADARRQQDQDRARTPDAPRPQDAHGPDRP